MIKSITILKDCFRPKKILHRDFADGVLIAEIIAHFFPPCVEIHNYVGSNNSRGKLKNWKLLNSKVLPRFGFTIPALKVCIKTFDVPLLIRIILRRFKKKLFSGHGSREKAPSKLWSADGRSKFYAKYHIR